MSFFDVVLGHDGPVSRHAEGSATVTIRRRLPPMPSPRGLHQSESSLPLSTGRESSFLLVRCIGADRPARHSDEYHCFWRKPMLSSKQNDAKDANLDSFWLEVCQDVKRGRTDVPRYAFTEAIWKRFGGQRSIPMNATRNFDFPDVQYILDTLIAGSSLIPLRETSRAVVESRESHRLNTDRLSLDKGARILGLCTLSWTQRPGSLEQMDQ